jgi:hypothetical protein
MRCWPARRPEGWISYRYTRLADCRAGPCAGITIPT